MEIDPNEERPCESCQGTGQPDEDGPCTDCGGKGTAPFHQTFLYRILTEILV